MNTTMPTDRLTPHPLNESIYGKEETDQVGDLLEKIRATGRIEPLWVTASGVIISGHRRWRCAKLLGLREVPVEIRTYANEAEETRDLLIANATRFKTMEQRVREAEYWNPIVRQKIMDGEIVGSTSRDELAKLVGIGSGRTYDRAKRVVQFADSLRSKGLKEDALALLRVMNDEGVEIAEKITKKPPSDRAEILAHLRSNDKARGRGAMNHVTLKRRREAAESVNDSCPLHVIETLAEAELLVDPNSVPVMLMTDADADAAQAFLLARFAVKEGGAFYVVCPQDKMGTWVAACPATFQHYWTLVLMSTTPTQPKKRKINSFYHVVLWFQRGEYEGSMRSDIIRDEGLLSRIAPESEFVFYPHATDLTLIGALKQRGNGLITTRSKHFSPNSDA